MARIMNDEQREQLDQWVKTTTALVKSQQRAIESLQTQIEDLRHDLELTEASTAAVEKRVQEIDLHQSNERQRLKTAFDQSVEQFEIFTEDTESAIDFLQAERNDFSKRFRELEHLVQSFIVDAPALMIAFGSVLKDRYTDNGGKASSLTKKAN